MVEVTKKQLLKVAPGEQEIKLTQLDSKIKYSLEDREKYSLVFDSTGDCETFFHYQGHMVELNKLQLSISLGKITKDEAIETLRKALVYAMRLGERLVLYCGRYAVDFKTEFNDPVNFPTELVFNFTEWRKEENYKRIVRDEEDKDLMGNMKCYVMNDSFGIVIVQDIQDVTEADDKREDFKQKIPLFNEQFETLFVSRNENKESEALAKAKLAEQNYYIPPNTGGTNMISFGKDGNVSRSYHVFDYANIYEPRSKDKKF